MATVKPFRCTRPAIELASRTAALPYDVYNRAEAREVALRDALSFLNIDRPETQFPEGHDMYAPEVYEKAASMLKERIFDGTYLCDDTSVYYIYELIMNGRHQTGIVATASIDDYLCGVIKKHENTREEKEIDRIKHVDTCSAQTGPIFLAYRSNELISGIVNRIKEEDKLYGFTSADGITHNVWRISEPADNRAIENEFKNINSIYIADGHHRAASAVKVGLKRRNENPEFTGSEDFNFFLSVLFPEDQLMIMPYNRVVKDLNGLTEAEFMAEVEKLYTVIPKSQDVLPDRKGTVGMYMEGKWYRLEAKEKLMSVTDPVASLDVSLLQDHLLAPVLGIGDPRTDKRIDFIGGIRGNRELERRCALDMKVAFSMYPTSISELFAVSDCGRLMPPKSTWFEPKLRSGIFIHRF